LWTPLCPLGQSEIKQGDPKILPVIVQRVALPLAFASVVATMLLVTPWRSPTPAQGATTQADGPCLATVTATTIESEGTIANNNGFFGYIDVQVDFDCGAGGQTECGVWDNSSHGTGGGVNGPFTPVQQQPPPQPALSRDFSCGGSFMAGFKTQVGPMKNGTFYKLTTIYGPLDANGNGGNNTSTDNDQSAVFDGTFPPP